jgi:prepilin-type N-terminal cleavage/methylation domain-containing protein
MPTSTTAPSIDARSRAPRTAGFTLIELSLVLLIIAIVLTLAIPRLRSASGAELTREARKLSNTFRLLRSEAILNGQIYQLRYDLDRERYWVTLGNPGGTTGSLVEDFGPLARGVTLSSPIGIRNVVLPDRDETEPSEVLLTNFYPDGSIDRTVVHIDDGREAYTLWVNPLTGRLNLETGDRDVEYPH